MKFNCQLNIVTSAKCLLVTSIVLNTLFLIDLSVYVLFFYWIFRIMTVNIKLTEFSQLPDEGLRELWEPLDVSARLVYIGLNDINITISNIITQ